MDRFRTTRWLLTALLASWGLWTVTVAERSTDPASPTPAPAVADSAADPASTPGPAPEVIVNGQPVSTDANGNVHVAVNEGEARVETSGGHTSVTLTDPHGETTVTGDGSLNVSVNSTSHGGWYSGVTQVYSSGYSSNAGSVSQQATVYSNGQSTVQINQ